MIKRVTRSPVFIKQVKHLDSFLLKKIKKQILKLIKNLFIGKPLKYYREERSLYIKPFRLIYAVRGDELILLKFKHRKSVYN